MLTLAMGSFRPYPYLWHICQNVIHPCVCEGISSDKFLFPSHYIALLLFKEWHGNCHEMENNQSSEENRRTALTAEWNDGVYNVCFTSHFLFEWRHLTVRFSITKEAAFHRTTTSMADRRLHKPDLLLMTLTILQHEEEEEEGHQVLFPKGIRTFEEIILPFLWRSCSSLSPTDRCEEEPVSILKTIHLL